jgi:hypothetical protein
MADALPSAGLIKLQETEHLGVTDQGKTQPQQKSGREKQSAKDSPNCFEGWPLAIVRPFQRQHNIDSRRAIVARRRLWRPRDLQDQLAAEALQVGHASLRLPVGTAVSQSGGRSRNRQQDECQEELPIVLPATNSDNSMTLRARSSSDVRIFINDTVSFYLWQAKAGFSRKRFENLGIGIPAAGFATKLGRRIRLEAGSE